MSTKFTYALILTIAGALLNLVLFFTGFQTEKLAVGQHLNWLGFIIQAIVLWLGMKAVREQTPEKPFTYGRGVGTGVLISLYSGLMSAVYTFVHFKFVNPDYVDYQMELIRQKWAQVGMSAADMEKAEPVARMFMGPTITAVMTPIVVTLCGTILALIFAAFLKREAAATQPPPLP